MRKFFCFIAALLPLACSVKEDRSVCPCELVVRSEDVLKTEGSVLVSVVQEGSVVKHSAVPKEMFKAILRARPFDCEEDAITAIKGGAIHGGNSHSGSGGIQMNEKSRVSLYYTTVAG